MSNNPFFIIGNPRSGTTMFRLMLHAHPEICVPPECGFALWLFDKYKNWDRSNDNLDSILQDILASRKMDTWHLESEKLTQFVEEHQPESYQDICDLVYRFYSLSVGKEIKVWGDKNNFYIDYIPTMKELFPSCKLIFITRDGRDVACSYRELNRREITSKFTPVLPNSIDDIAIEWMENNNKAISSFKNIEQEDIYYVRYEDLILNTSPTLAEATIFLGLEYHPDMLAYYKDDSEPEEFLQWKLKTREKPDARNVGRYKKQLTQDQIQQFENIAGSMLQKFGYVLEAIGN